MNFCNDFGECTRGHDCPARQDLPGTAATYRTGWARLDHLLQAISYGVGSLMRPDHHEQHLDMAPPGWQLVPMEPVAWVWNPARECWERVRAFGNWQQGAIYAFGPDAPASQAREPLTDAELTKLKPKPREKGWIYTEAQMMAYARKVEAAHGIGPAAAAPQTTAADLDVQEQHRTALQAIEKLNAEIGRISEQRDKLLRALNYIAAMTNDGHAKRHAREAIAEVVLEGAAA